MDEDLVEVHRRLTAEAAAHKARFDALSEEARAAIQEHQKLIGQISKYFANHFGGLIVEGSQVISFQDGQCKVVRTLTPEEVNVLQSFHRLRAFMEQTGPMTV